MTEPQVRDESGYEIGLNDEEENVKNVQVDCENVK